jgi:hypothetical protein
VDPGHQGAYVEHPQSWNGYIYAGNNPLRFTDPTGTDYLINVDGGTPFWFEEGFGDFKALQRYLGDQGFSAMGGPERLDPQHGWSERRRVHVLGTIRAAVWRHRADGRSTRQCPCHRHGRRRHRRDGFRPWWWRPDRFRIIGLV